MARQLWQHEESDEVYVVETNYRTVLAAAGPLEPPEYRAALRGEFKDDATVRAALTANPAAYRLVDLRWQRRR
jgi:hypothetical protein